MKGKTVLIIGGTGTLGKALIDKLLLTHVHSIRVFARNEHKMFQLKQSYNDQRLRFLIGDIRDKKRLNMAFAGADIAINCAALKHVSLCAENPFEALQTNVIGTQNALECAVKNNIETFIQISTDKAVNPTNIYGCSKAMSECLTLDAPNWQGNNRTKFAVIRSGNIMASSGSCYEIWDSQYKAGYPLTITDLNAERYMAPKDSIANAVLKVVSKPDNGIYVLNMPKFKVSEMISKYGDYPIQITGLKPGEKLIEELYGNHENYTLIDIGGD